VSLSLDTKQDATAADCPLLRRSAPYFTLLAALPASFRGRPAGIAFAPISVGQRKCGRWEMVRKLITMSGVLLLLAGVAGAQSIKASGRKDLQILKDVVQTVDRYTQFTIFDDINAVVEDGSVTLTGKVTMPYKRDEIEKRVARVDGVRGVINQIRVLPVSSFDDELRYRIARSIYSNSNFWNYAILSNPSIHIVVEHGHVTLTGVVQNNVDRVLARSLASQFGALSITNDLKTDAEVQASLEKSE
jgi:hyperosmotically inducible protein